MLIYLVKKLKVRVVAYLNKEHVELPDSKRVFIFLAADYGNIGDLAITYAQEKFLASVLPEFSVVRVPISKTRNQICAIKAQIRSDDLITIVGGGNMGSLYPDIEELRQLVIKSFRHNKVVCFPQSLDWSDNSESKRAIKKIRKVYSEHPNIHLFARERKSLEFLQLLFEGVKNVRIGFSPDIVLSQTMVSFGANNETSSNSALLCLRKDKEKKTDDNFVLKIESHIKQLGLKVKFTDTHIGKGRLLPNEGNSLVVEKLAEFAKARLIITDRLHGMILGALSGTSTLAIPNSNHKIQQTWKDWMTAIPNVRFWDPENGDLTQINKILDVTSVCRNENTIDISNFDSLKSALKAKKSSLDRED